MDQLTVLMDHLLKGKGKMHYHHLLENSRQQKVTWHLLNFGDCTNLQYIVNGLNIGVLHYSFHFSFQGQVFKTSYFFRYWGPILNVVMDSTLIKGGIGFEWSQMLLTTSPLKLLR